MLLNNSKSGSNKSPDSCLEVTMGRYDRAKVSQLVGMFVLCRRVIDVNDIDFCRDDCLIFGKNFNDQKVMN